MNNLNKNQLEKLSKLYDKMSLDIINTLKDSNLDPNDVAHESGLSSDKMLELLFDSKNGDYLAYREMDESIKRLSKIKKDELKK